MRVLIAEDERRLADAIARGLRREGMAVDLAPDGSDALLKARVIRYDVLVLDRDLPGVHGDEVCRAVRGEIGLRRALGATRRHISSQFLAESALLAALGGIAGLLLGALATLVYSLAQNQPMVVPAYALVAAPGAGLAIGAIAGLYPAAKAARLSPTEALRAS